MTVKELMCALSTLPEDSIVTDDCNREILDVAFEPDEVHPEKTNVWICTEPWC